MWRVLLATGMRRGEVLGLQWPDADLEGGTLTVARQVLPPPRAPQIPYVGETTKTRVRRVRVDEQTTAALRAWKVQQASERLLFGGAWKTDGGLGVDAPWIVTEPDEWLVRPATLAARLAALVKLAGVPAITLHALATTTRSSLLGPASDQTSCRVSLATRRSVPRRATTCTTTTRRQPKQRRRWRRHWKGTMTGETEVGTHE